jgi:hypothetical protein
MFTSLASRRCLAFGLAAVSALAAGPAAAQPFGTRLSHHGDPRTSVSISWCSSSTADSGVVLGTAPGDLSRAIPADETFAIGGDLGTCFTARVEGLTADTEYHYRVGSGGTLHPAASAPPFSFHTLPDDPCAPFRVIVIGDNRGDFDGIGNPLWADVLDEAMEQMPDVFVNTGDMVKNGERDDEWADFLGASEPGFAYVPTLPTMGNHDEDDVDGDGAIYNRAFGLPRNSATATEDYYSIDIGPIHFVSLNTQHLAGTQLTAMVAWLDADLAATTQPYSIAFFHKAVYSRGGHPTGEENGGAINRELIPVFDRHSVDLVLNGHSHDYERFAPSRGADGEFGGAGRTFPLGNGATVRAMTLLPDGDTATTYIVTGGAGAFTSPSPDLGCLGCRPIPIPGVCDCDTDVLDRDVSGTVMFDGRHNFVVLDVDGPELHVEAYVTRAGNSSGGTVIDTFTIADATWTGGVCEDPMPGTDGGVPLADGGGADGGTPGADAGPRDAGRVPDAGRPGADAGTGGSGSDDGGCGCRVASRRDALAWALAMALLGVVVAVRVRARQRP